MEKPNSFEVCGNDRNTGKITYVTNNIKIVMGIILLIMQMIMVMKQVMVMKMEI